MLATGTSGLMSGEGNQDDEGVDTCASPRLYLKGTTPVHFYVQNLSNRDFVMEFRAFGDKVKEAGKGYYLYAEYKDGELVMH